MNKTQFAYDQSADAYEKKFSSYQTYLDRIKSFTSRMEEHCSILDLGCGPGINARFFTDRGHKVTGVDLSSSMISLARKNCPTGTFYNEAVNDFKSDLNFDAICLSFVIVHLKNDETERLLKNLNTFCNNNALIYISFMTGKISGYESTSFSDNEMFFNYYEPKSIIKKMKSMGYQMISRDKSPYEEEDGSITEDIFLIFRYKEHH